MNNYCIITNKYPNDVEPNVLVFVQQLVWSLVDMGIKCSVICPLPVNLNIKYAKLPYKTYEITENGNRVDIYFPKYIGFGQSDILGFNPAKITTHMFTKAVEKVIEKMETKPDIAYGHFVTPAGIATARIGRKLNIPTYMAYGEASYKTIEHFGINRVREELSTLNGIIAVSTKNKEMLINKNLIDSSKIIVLPNGYREERFYPRDKTESRRKFNFPIDGFIISFVGSFDERKGIERLIKAVEELNIDNMYVIAAGKGDLTPNSRKCIFKQSVHNEELPWFYSASDVFVLPTLNEGCCNAIIEAMACGIPIISSDMSFNDDILTSNNSLRINPLNIEEIKSAIYEMYINKQLRDKIANECIRSSRNLTLHERAKKIINFIDMNIKLTNLGGTNDYK